MSGSLLGRGRGGRLAVYAGCVAVVVLLVFAYRAAVTEMARLRDLQEECTIHQESLQQRLQVIFDYKVRLEKSLADETSANAAVKQELQQRATREKSRRDKDNIEAMQQYNSLQQAHKILETEKKDLQEECDKRQKQALDDTTRLETTLQGLRAELKQAKDDKAQSIEHLKSKYLHIDNEKTRIQEKYNNLVKTNDNVHVENQHLKQEVAQLTRELDYARKSCNGASLAIPSMSSPSSNFERSEMRNNQQMEGGDAGEGRGGQAASQNSINLARPPAVQQVSPPSKNENGNQPQPIQAPRNHQAIKTGVKNVDDTLPNELISDVGFELKGGGIIVPVGPRRTGDHKEIEVNLNVLPMPYNFKDKDKEKERENEKEKEKEMTGKASDTRTQEKDDNSQIHDTLDKVLSENVGDIPRKFAPQSQRDNAYQIDSDNINNQNNDNNNVLAAPFPIAQKSSSIGPGVGRGSDNAQQQIPIVKIQDEMQVLQDKLEVLDNSRN